MSSGMGSGQKIYVVDDDLAVRDSICLLMDSIELNAEPHASAQSFLDGYDGSPGVLILDVRMPGMGGLALHEELKEKGLSQLSVIFISGHGDIPMAVSTLKKGARDFFPKPFRDQDLLDRVLEVLAENEQQMQRLIEISDIKQRLATLTARESEVMLRVSEGQANKVVAIDLDISTRTVEIHRAQVMKKMQVKSLAQLVRLLEKVR